MTEIKTFSAFPFIAFDGVDDNGVRAEVKVVVGCGTVLKTEASGAGKSKKVFFEVSNTKHNPAGWVPADSNVFKKIEEAEANGTPIEFRIETKRKDTVDRTLKMDEVAPKGDMNKARDNTFKSLAAVKFTDEDDWTISPHALTRIDEDPRASGGHSAYDMTPEEIAAGKASKVSASAPKPYGFEPQPWFTRNANGDVNPGSVAVGVPITLYSFIAEWESAHNLTLSEKQRVILTKALLSTANKLQVAIYEGKEEELEQADLSLGSHTRARALIFDMIKIFYPLTDDVVSSSDNIKEWVGNIHDKALGMWKWSLSEIDKIS